MRRSNIARFVTHHKHFLSRTSGCLVEVIHQQKSGTCSGAGSIREEVERRGGFQGQCDLGMRDQIRDGAWITGQGSPKGT